MSHGKRCLYLMVFIAVTCFFFNIPRIEAADYNILVIMSYEENNPWCIQIKAGIDSVFAGNSDVKYFYMDTKKNIKGGVRKAKDAYELYKRLRPDGIIAADDNAQSMMTISFYFWLF